MEGCNTQPDNQLSNLPTDSHEVRPLGAYSLTYGSFDVLVKQREAVAYNLVRLRNLDSPVGQQVRTGVKKVAHKHL